MRKISDATQQIGGNADAVERLVPAIKPVFKWVGDLEGSDVEVEAFLTLHALAKHGKSSSLSHPLVKFHSPNRDAYALDQQSHGV